MHSKLWALALLLLTSCAADFAASASALVTGEQIVYDVWHPVPQSELDDLPTDDPTALGGEVLAGDPRISARIDHQTATASGGVFQVTRGRLRVFYPFTEHATILWGSVTITDEAGVSHTYFPGDSYLIGQGSVVLVDIHSHILQKSFLNIVEPAE